MATKNINVSPYYDDFDASKNYHKILFRPTFSVQARELTQLQTILQDQISKGTDAILENGNNLVPGEIILRRDISYVTLSTNTTGFDPNITLANLPGKTITDGTISAKVIAVSDLTTTESLTLFVSYINSDASTTPKFVSAAILEESGTGYDVGIVGTYTGLTAPTAGITGTGSVAQVGGGVYYINGHMVNVTAQALVLDKYTTIPTYRIGFTVGESFVDNSTDSTLNDNAQGTTNYLAPGAHRYKISLTLAKRTLTDTVSANNKGFVEVCRVVSGVIQKHDNFVESLVTDLKYNDRDYNENGNYIVDDFDIEIREYSSTLTDRNGLNGRNVPADANETAQYEADLEIGIGVGSAVINGKKVTKNEKTWLKIDKARETADDISLSGSAMNADIGSYVTSNSTGVFPERKYPRSKHPVVRYLDWHKLPEYQKLAIYNDNDHTQETGFTYGMVDGRNSSGLYTFSTSDLNILQFANSSTAIEPYKKVILGELHTTQKSANFGSDSAQNREADQGTDGGDRFAFKRGTARIRDIRKNQSRRGEVDVYLFDVVSEGVQENVTSEGVVQNLSTVNCLAIDDVQDLGLTGNDGGTGYTKIICQLNSNTFSTYEASKNTSLYEIPEGNVLSVSGVDISEVRRTSRVTPTEGGTWDYLPLTVSGANSEEFVIEREFDSGAPKQSSLDNILVYGKTHPTNGNQTMFTSDSLDITFNTATTATVQPTSGAVGAFRLQNKIQSGRVTTVDVVSSGTGYSLNDMIYLTDNSTYLSGIRGRVMVSAVNADAITDIPFINASGTGYVVDETFNIGTPGEGGTQATGKVTLQESGTVTKVEVVNGGSNYTVGNGITTSGASGIGDNALTLSIVTDSIVTELEVTDGGSGYSMKGDGVTLTLSDNITTGSGSGLTGAYHVDTWSNDSDGGRDGMPKQLHYGDIFRIYKKDSSGADLKDEGAIVQRVFTGTEQVTRTFDGSSNLVVDDEAIKIVGHGFNSGDPVKYSNGGGTNLTNLTNNTTYWVIAFGSDKLWLASSETDVDNNDHIPIEFSTGAAHTLTGEATTGSISETDFAGWKVIHPGRNLSTVANTTPAQKTLFYEVLSSRNAKDLTSLGHNDLGQLNWANGAEGSASMNNFVMEAANFEIGSSYDVVYSVKKGRRASDAGRADKTLSYVTQTFYGIGSAANNVVDSNLGNPAASYSNVKSIGNEYLLNSIDIHPKEGTWKVLMADDFNDGLDGGPYPNDITSRYTLDTGQRDEFYTRGKLILKPNEPKPIGNLQVTYWKFTHGAGDYFSIESYPDIGSTYSNGGNDWKGATLNFTVDDIPSFVGSTGRTYRLGDCIDFRSTKGTTGDLDNSDIFKDSNGGLFKELPANNATITIETVSSTDSVSINGGRVDKISLDENGNFSLITGNTYATDVVAPEDLEGELSLYTLRMLPYTLTTDDVYVDRVDNKRYTMGDLKDIEKRIEQLELYSTLSPLEVEAKDFNHGFDFVSGFWVDSFLGHDKGDPGSTDYLCAIDANNKELRAAFVENSVSHTIDSSIAPNTTSTLLNIDSAGSLVTLEKKTTGGDVGEFINLETDTTDSIRSHPAGTYYGYMSLSPFFDNWKSTESRPDVVFDKKKYFSSIKSLTNASDTQGTIWNDWKHHWSGSKINDSKVSVVTDTGLDSNSMSEFETNRGFSIVSEKRGTREIAKNYLPYCRSKTITITVSGLKPSTLPVEVYFDDVQVTADVVPSSSDYGTQGAATLKTHTDGSFSGTYTIVNSDEGVVSANYPNTTKFRVGRKLVKVTTGDSEAQAVYNVSGYVDDIGMTNVAEFSQSEQLAEILGQELIVDEDCFISKIDLYFSAVDSVRPVIVQLREMDAGKPTGKVLPYSTKVITPTLITAATTVTYSDYIFLKSGRYCLSLHSTSDEYAVYSLNTDAAVGSKSINIGNMYRGTKRVTNKTLKFQAYRAEFKDNANTDVAVFNVGVNSNKTLGALSVYTNADDTESSKYMRIFMDAHGFKVDDTVSFNSFIGSPIQVLNFGNGAGTGGSVTGTFAVGTLVATDTTDPNLWSGGEAIQGIVVDWDTSVSSAKKLTVALTSNTKFPDNPAGTMVSQHQVADGNAVVYGTYKSLETELVGVNGIPVSHINASGGGGTFNVESVDYDSFVVKRNGGTELKSHITGFATAFDSSSLVTPFSGTINSARRRGDSIYHGVEQVIPKGTSISWQYSTDNSVYKAIDINETDILTSTEFLAGNIYLKATFTTTSNRVSPVVDLNTLQSIIISNRLNDKNPSIGNTGTAANNTIDRRRIFDPPVSGTSAGSRLVVAWDTDQPEPNITQGTLSGTSNGPADEEHTHKLGLQKISVGDYLYITVGDLSGIETQLVYVYSILDKFANAITINFKTIGNEKFILREHDLTSAATNGYGVGVDIYTGFVDEWMSNNTSSISNYIGKRVNLQETANKLKVVADTKIPKDTDVEVWVRSSITGYDTDFDRMNYVKCDLTRFGLQGAIGKRTPAVNDNKFHEAEWIATKVPSFTTAQLKIVLKGSSTLDSPRIKNLKVFALNDDETKSGV